MVKLWGFIDDSRFYRPGFFRVGVMTRPGVLTCLIWKYRLNTEQVRQQRSECSVSLLSFLLFVDLKMQKLKRNSKNRFYFVLAMRFFFVLIRCK